MDQAAVTRPGFVCPPEGCEVTQDPDSPLVWRVEELTDPKRVLLFFVESIGGIDE